MIGMMEDREVKKEEKEERGRGKGNRLIMRTYYQV
jgi:hypothetical protein